MNRAAILGPIIVPKPIAPSALDARHWMRPVPAELLENDDRMTRTIIASGRSLEELTDLPLGTAGQRPIHAVLGFEQNESTVMQAQEAVDDEIPTEENISNAQAMPMSQEEVDQLMLEAGRWCRAWSDCNGGDEAVYTRRHSINERRESLGVDDAREVADPPF